MLDVSFLVAPPWLDSFSPSRDRRGGRQKCAAEWAAGISMQEGPLTERQVTSLFSMLVPNS